MAVRQYTDEELDAMNIPQEDRAAVRRKRKSILQILEAYEAITSKKLPEDHTVLQTDLDKAGMVLVRGLAPVLVIPHTLVVSDNSELKCGGMVILPLNERLLPFVVGYKCWEADPQGAIEAFEEFCRERAQATSGGNA